MDDILQGLMAAVIILSLCSPVIAIGVFYYLKKRLDHKQIMTAIEKGTPLSEIMPPKPKPAGPAWIKFVSTGIMLIIIGLGFTFLNPMHTSDVGALIFAVLCGVGVGMLIRGLLHRKYYLKNEISANNNSTEKEKSA
ncbi:MAG: DUF6249 domain-containing protein [Planctomycetota bacterium]|jgi:hypothetical protein